MSFAEDKLPIESQLMLDYANGMKFTDVLLKYREHLAADLRTRTLLCDDCPCAEILENY